MKRAATLLGIAATALSLNATTHDFAPLLSAAELVPASMATAAASLSDRATASILQTDSQQPDTTMAWVFALGFLGIVVLRRTRSGPI